MSSSVCGRFRFWNFPNSYLLEPLDGSCSSTLCISRPDGALSFIESPPSTPPTNPPITAFGVLGIINLLSGPYVIIITKREKLGSYRNFPVYRILKASIFACNLNSSNLSRQQKKDEDLYIKSLNSAVNSHGLIFSYNKDLTHSAQVSLTVEENDFSLPLWKQADSHFFWNKFLLESFFQNEEISPFILPVVQGSFQSIQMNIEDKVIQFTLIARRNVGRLGTRMWRRGADKNSGISNFVESEQILEIDDNLFSFVQVRGSIPISWEQIVDLTYKPKIKILNLDNNLILSKHFNELKGRYDSVLAIDLINQKGSESKLGKVFSSCFEKLADDKIKYVPFDFHHVCGHVHFERLSILFDQIYDTFIEQGYFCKKGDNILKMQRGIIRTNCIDCLDRTNVTQNFLGKKCLEQQIQFSKLFNSFSSISQYPLFDKQFKIIWANHGDDISLQYAGTHALKGDFVRHGQRRLSGVLKDGRSSLLRYLFNNFFDGIHQDGLALVSGKFVVDKSSPSPFSKKGVKQFMDFSAVVLVVVLAKLISLYSIFNVGKLSALFILSTVAFYGFVFVLFKKFGKDFCNTPRL